MATVSQDQPPGLLSHVPSWLAAVVLLHNYLTVSYDRSQKLCEPGELLLGVSVYFPRGGIQTESEVYKPNYSTVTRNKIQWNKYVGKC